MAEDQEQKGTTKLLITKLFNKSAFIVNVIICAFLLYQIVDLFSVYSKKTEEIFKQGRIITIGVKDNKIDLNDLSDKELALQKSEFNNKNVAAIKPEDFQGPMPAEPKPEDLFVGPPAPDKKVVETKKAESPQNLLPIVPLDYKTANLAVIVTEAGLKQSELDGARILPKEVSFAFSPYSDELQKKIDFAKRDGREVMLNLIFNPSDYPTKDGGPLSIQANYDEAQNLANFASTVNLARDYVGLLANNNETITNKFDKLSPLLKKITERKVFFGFFKNNTNANLENDVKPFATDVFAVDFMVDEDMDEEKMKAKLNEIKELLVIKKRRVVIAITGSPLSVKVLKKWLDENIGATIQIAPISYFVTNN